MVGGQTSLEVGIAAAVVAVFFGALYGAISGFAGGSVDAVMMRIVDAGLSLPSLMVHHHPVGDLPPARRS